MTGLFFQITLLGLLFAFSAFFSATETALFSLSPLDLAGFKKDSLWKQRVAELMQRPNQVLTSILLGNNLVNVMSVLTFSHLLNSIPIYTLWKLKLPWVSVLVEVVGITSVLLLLGEIVPKSLALRYAKLWLRFSIYPFLIIHSFLGYTGLRHAFGYIIRSMIGVVKKAVGEVGEHATSAEVQTAVELAKVQGHLGPEESILIAEVLKLSSMHLRYVMIDKSQVVSVDDSLSANDALNICSDKGFPALPVYSKSQDKVIAVFWAKLALEHGTSRSLLSLTTEPLFLAEISSPQILLDFAIGDPEALSVVVDEFGAYLGIVTPRSIWNYLGRDMLTEKKMEGVTPTSEGYSISALLRPDIIEDLWGEPVAMSDYQTINGWLLGKLQRIPRTGEWVVVDGVKCYIEEAKANRVISLFLPKKA